MHKLTEHAKNAVDQAEMYWRRRHAISVAYENNRLQQITENDLSSVALRVIDGGKMGSTFGVSPDQDGLIEQAKTAAAHGDPAAFAFAPAALYVDVVTSDPNTAALTSEDLVTLCESVKDAITTLRDDLPLFINAEAERSELVIETTEGADAHSVATRVSVDFGAPIRGAGMPVFKAIESVSPLSCPDERVSEFVEWYGWTEKTSTPTTGRLPVIFAPEASFLYLLPLWAGIEGNAIEKRTSPLVDRVGQSIFSEKLTVFDDPLAPGMPGSRPFDDEGVPCQRRAIVEKGILRGYLLDRRTAASLGRASTGSAVKRELHGGGTETMPSPWPIRLSVRPGEMSYRNLIAEIEEGLLVYFGMGFHSGNYPRGQFAVQAIGYHIRDGAVLGRLDRTMVSANIYEDFKRIRAVSTEQGRAAGFLNVTAPYVLVDSLQVSGK
jgi:PmbA protein